MGSPSYDFLGHSFLFDEALVAESFRTVPDAELERELQGYREYIDASPATISGEAKTRIVAGAGDPDLRLLTQCAWYVEEFVVRDPLYELTSPKTNAQAPMEQYLGLKRRTSDERREDVVGAVNKMRKLVPMVAAGYVTALPISRAFEPPPNLPITVPIDGGANLLPSQLMEWFKQRARVCPVEIRDGTMIMFNQDVRNSPRRSIGVQFRLDSGEEADWSVASGSEAVFLYHLFEQQIVSFDEETRIAEFASHLPEVPPSEELYRAWVRQTIHQAAAAFADRTMRAVRLAGTLRARFMTSSPLTAAFLSLADPASHSSNVVQTTLNAVLNFDVPLLEGVAIEDLMRVRQEEGEAFQAFRFALERELRALELESDSVIARAKADHVRHELASVQLAAIKSQVKSYRTKLFADSALGIGSLLASVPTGGLSLIATGMAAASFTKAKAEYDASVKGHPAYFLWCVQKAAKV